MGLWGGGATFTERELRWTGENTVYSTWTQEGLLGPRRGERLELAPALWGITTWGAFLDRHGDAATCAVWDGEEILGVGCEQACRRIARDCPERLARPCRDVCTQLPRHFVDCMRDVPACDFRQCDLPNIEVEEDP